MVQHAQSSLKLQIVNISRKGEWFCSYLHLVRYPLRIQKYAILGCHRLSTNQIVRCFKLKKLENCMRYQVDFLLPLKLQKISCYFGLWPQNTLGELVVRIFYFWLIWLVNVNIEVLLLHCTCLNICFCWEKCCLKDR